MTMAASITIISVVFMVCATILLMRRMDDGMYPDLIAGSTP